LAIELIVILLRNGLVTRFKILLLTILI
jgi:hypothetical protein